MSHERTRYRCGCIAQQCRCPGPHRDRWLDVPCPKHPDISVATAHGTLTVKSDARLAPNEWRLEDTG